LASVILSFIVLRPIKLSILGEVVTVYVPAVELAATEVHVEAVAPSLSII